MASIFLAFTTAVSTMAELLKRKRPQPNSREGSADSPIRKVIENKMLHATRFLTSLTYYTSSSGG